jgi:hypothetical protein
MTYHDSFTTNLRKLMKVEKNIKSPCLVYDGDLNIPVEGEELDVGVFNFRECSVKNIFNAEGRQKDG